MQAYFEQMQGEILDVLRNKAEHFITLQNVGYTTVGDYKAMDEDRSSDMLMFTITYDEQTLMSKLTEVCHEPADVVYQIQYTPFNLFMIQYLSRQPLADVNHEPVPFNSALDYKKVGTVFELTTLRNLPKQRADRRIFEQQILNWSAGRPAMRHFILRPRCEFELGIMIMDELVEHIGSYFFNLVI